MEEFFLRCDWGVREESLDQCAGRMIEFLKELANLDDLFTRLVPTATRRSQRRYSLDEVKECLAQGVTHTDVGNQLIRELGYSMSMHAVDGDATMTLSIACGGFSPWVRNVCSIVFPSTGNAAERIIRLEPLVRIMDAATRHWNPEHGIVSSHECSNLLSPTNLDFEAGWITYVPANCRSLSTLQMIANVVATTGGQLIIIGTAERLSSANPDHMRTVEAVSKAIAAC
jgi:hypothetical protein